MTSSTTILLPHSAWRPFFSASCRSLPTWWRLSNAFVDGRNRGRSLIIVHDGRSGCAGILEGNLPITDSNGVTRIDFKRFALFITDARRHAAAAHKNRQSAEKCQAKPPAWVAWNSGKGDLSEAPMHHGEVAGDTVREFGPDR